MLMKRTLIEQFQQKIHQEKLNAIRSLSGNVSTDVNGRPIVVKGAKLGAVDKQQRLAYIVPEERHVQVLKRDESQVNYNRITDLIIKGKDDKHFNTKHEEPLGCTENLPLSARNIKHGVSIAEYTVTKGGKQVLGKFKDSIQQPSIENRYSLEDYRHMRSRQTTIKTLYPRPNPSVELFSDSFEENALNTFRESTKYTPRIITQIQTSQEKLPQKSSPRKLKDSITHHIGGQYSHDKLSESGNQMKIIEQLTDGLNSVPHISPTSNRNQDQKNIQLLDHDSIFTTYSNQQIGDFFSKRKKTALSIKSSLPVTSPTFRNTFKQTCATSRPWVDQKD